jgi:hypothetical protein
MFLKNPDCAELLKKVIDNVGKGKAYSGDPLTIFNRVQSEGGFHLRVQKNSGDSTFTRAGKRIVYINQVFD